MTKLLKDVEKPFFWLFLLDSDGVGGTERVVTTIVEHLQQNYSAASVGLFVATASAGQFTPKAGIVFRGGWEPEKQRMTQAAWAVKAELKRRVAQLETEGFEVGIVAATPHMMTLALLAGYRSRTIFWTHFYYPAVASSSPLPRRLSLLACAVLAKNLVCQDLALAARMPRFPRIHESATIIPNPLKAKDSCATPEATHNELLHALVAEEKPLILYIGRLSEEKCPEKILVLAGLHDKATFVLLGEGPMRPQLERLAAGIPNVYLPGVEAHPRAWLQHAAAVVLCSKFEAYPTVVLEALQEGVPVATTPSSPALSGMLPGSLSKGISTGASVKALNETLSAVLRPEVKQLFTAYGPKVVEKCLPSNVGAQWMQLLERARRK